jgi:hypothetical protein
MRRSRGIGPALWVALASTVAMVSCGQGPHILYGFIDDQGLWAVAPEYEDALPPAEGRIAVKRGDAWGFVDTQGRSVVDPQYSQALPFTEGLAAVDSGGRWHFIDPAGCTIIPGPFADAHPFKDGLAAVRVDALWGFVDHAGGWVIEPGFEELAEAVATGSGLTHMACFSEGLCAARRGERWGFIDRSGAWVIEPRFIEADAFHEGLAAVREATGGGGGQVGFIDRHGKMVIPPRFESALWFSGGRAIASLIRPRDEDRPPPVDAAGPEDGKDIRVVMIDATGDEIADLGWGPDPGFVGGARELLSLVAPDYLSEGLVPAARDGAWGFMDRAGRWAIPPRFALVLPFRNGLAPVGLRDEPGADPLDIQRWGLIDTRGNWVIEPELSSISLWGGALMSARLHSRWGVIDRDGKWRVEPAYAEMTGLPDLPGVATPSAEGLQRAGLYANHRWSVMDLRGRRVSAMEYQWLQAWPGAAHGSTWPLAYMERGLWGMADEKLRPVTTAQLDERPWIVGEGGLAKVSVKGQWGCLDRRGRWAVPAQFSQIESCGPDRVRARRGSDWGFWEPDAGWRASAEARPEDESGIGAAAHEEPLGARATWRPEGQGYVFYRDDARQAGVPPVDEVQSRFIATGLPGQGEWFAIVRRGDRWGVIDERGRQRLPLRFEAVGAIHDGLFAVRQEGNWGIVDGRGRTVFAPTFERAMPFSRDVAIFCKGMLCGLADKSGKVLLEPTYSMIVPLSGRLAVATMTSDDGRFISSGLVDVDGQVLVGQEYYSISRLSGHLLKAWDARGRYHLLQESTGRPVPGLPEVVGQVGALSEGLATVELRQADGPALTGYIDPRGRLVVAPRFDTAGEFQDGVAVVTLGGRCGAIDRRGRAILAIEYQHCQHLPGGRVLFAEEAPLRLAAPPEAGSTPP